MAHIDDEATQRANVRFIKRSMKAPVLSREEEQELARRWRGEHDEEALHSLISAYERLVISIASRFRNYGLPLGDLIQEGNVGLLQAAERFEPEREVRFSTYAAWWIRAAVQDFVLRNWSIVRTGTTAAQKSLFFNLRRLRARLQDTTGAPLDEDGRQRIASELNVSATEVEKMEARMALRDQSLNVSIREDTDDELVDFVNDGRPDPEQIVIGMRDAAARSRWLHEALQQLSQREQRIIRERRLAEEGKTLEQLGIVLGVSKERVRQIEHRALSKLRVALQQHTDDPHNLFVEGPA